MRFQRVLAEIAAATAGAVVLAGCTSSPPEPEPFPEPTLSSAASPPSPSPSISPPTPPPEAEGTSPKAAKAFARYYIQLVSHAIVSGDTSELRKVSSEDCVSCDAIAGNIEEIYAAGGHIKSDGWRVRTIQVLGTAGDSTVLSLGLYLETETIVSGDGGIERHDGHEQPMTMRLIRQHGFLVEELELVA
jgi:hypothetical protein